MHGAELPVLRSGGVIRHGLHKIAVYRDAWRAAGHAGTGVVTLMLHTFVGADDSAVRETVREPMKSYLRSSVGLIKGFAGAWTASRRGAGQTQVAGDEFDKLSSEDMDSLLDFAFERYFETSGLFGSQARCLELVERLQEAGVDEIACLIDFGVPTEEVLSHLNDLDAVRLQAMRSSRSADPPDPPHSQAHGSRPISRIRHPSESRTAEDRRRERPERWRWDSGRGGRRERGPAARPPAGGAPRAPRPR